MSGRERSLAPLLLNNASPGLRIDRSVAHVLYRSTGAGSGIAFSRVFLFVIAIYL